MFSNIELFWSTRWRSGGDGVYKPKVPGSNPGRELFFSSIIISCYVLRYLVKSTFYCLTGGRLCIDKLCAIHMSYQYIRLYSRVIFLQNRFNLCIVKHVPRTIYIYLTICSNYFSTSHVLVL